MTLEYETTIYVHSIKHQRHGECHRLDGPAKIWIGGDSHYYQYGKLHRDAGPARITLFNRNSIELYYINGVNYCRQEYESKIRNRKNESLSRL